jgi:hypothetical protein
LEQNKISYARPNGLYPRAYLHSKLNRFSENLFIINNAFSTHAIAYNHIIFDSIIDKYENIKTLDNYTDIYDVWLSNNIQTRNKSYITYILHVKEVFAAKGSGRLWY